MITRSLEKAQTKIEELNFDARKHVLAYDDVLNVQRQSVYGRRRALLTGDDAAIDAELLRLSENDQSLEETLASKKSEFGTSFYPAIRRFLLQTIDLLWVDHLEAMEYLRSSVNLRAYGQRDPLVEYKKEGLKLFQAMETGYSTRAREIVAQMTLAPQAILPIQKEERAIREAAQAITSSGETSSKAYGRNDHVTITNGTETLEMKYKKAESMLATGQWRIQEGA